LDTRPGLPVGDNVNNTPLDPGQEFHLKVTGAGGVPAENVGAVVLNVTVTQPAEAGFLTVFPGGETAPNASNLNFVAGQDVPNLVIAKVGANGEVWIKNGTTVGTTHVIVDAVGYMPV
jgi:hypothetical protein